MRSKNYSIEDLLRSIEKTNQTIENKNAKIQQYADIIERTQYNMEKEQKNLPSYFEKKQDYSAKLMDMYKAQETTLINDILETKLVLRKSKIDQLNTIRSHIGLNPLELASF